MAQKPLKFAPVALILPREGSAVYYIDREEGEQKLVLVAPTRAQAQQLAFDLSKFYDIPLKGWEWAMARKVLGE